MDTLDRSGDIIRTARLVLRPLRDGDETRIFELIAHWEVVRFLASPPWPYAPEDARAFVRARTAPDPNFITFAITHGGSLIGIIDAINKPASAVQRAPGYAIGYWLGQPYWGEGFISEAARAFIAHVFATIPADAIYSGAQSEHAASLRIQEKLGFVSDGEAMLYTAPHGKELPTTRTVLTRARFAAAVAEASAAAARSAH